MIRVVVCCAVLCAAAWAGSAKFFDRRVAPILAKNCLGCHNHELNDGDISFEDRASLLKDREGRGPAVVPGKPEQSALIRAVRHDGDVQMPPGKKLGDGDIEVLVKWVKGGAKGRLGGR